MFQIDTDLTMSSEEILRSQISRTYQVLENLDACIGALREFEGIETEKRYLDAVREKAENELYQLIQLADALATIAQHYKSADLNAEAFSEGIHIQTVDVPVSPISVPVYENNLVQAIKY